MKFRFVVLAVICFPVWAQLTSTQDTVVATVNGQKLTLRDFNALVARADAPTKELAQKQPEEFLRQLALLQLISEEAEKSKLDQMSPYRERIAEQRRQLLFQARIDEQSKASTPTDEQIMKAFEARRASEAEARVKVIFISLISQTRALKDDTVVSTSGPEQARKKAEAVLKRAKAGEDFAKLAKELSDDPATIEKDADFPEPVRATSANIPTNMRDAIMAAKVGDIVGPIQHDTGYYIFRVESSGAPEFAKVKEEITAELRNQAMKKWIEEMRTKATVTVSAPSLLAPKQ